MSHLHVRPLPIFPKVLIVDDQQDALEVRMEAFRVRGCQPIGARSRGEALLRLRSNPGIGLLATDINLDSSREGDRDGIVLTRQVKEILPKLPVVGVSAQLADLAEQEKMLFDDIHLKGSPEKILDKVSAWRKRAIDYLNARPSRALEEFERLRKKYQINESDYRLMREFIPLGVPLEQEVAAAASAAAHSAAPTPDEAGPMDAVHRTVCDLGYTLKIIETADIPAECANEHLHIGKAIPVWAHEANGTMVVELYGFPQVYGYGTTEREAIAQLLFLMAGYHQDLKDAAPHAHAPGVLRLRDFLDSVFG
jgi:CheY-like chemotaxis protein